LGWRQLLVSIRHPGYNATMQARYHALSGGIAALALTPVLGIDGAVFFCASVLIDSDHYLDYLYRNKFTNFSIERMFEYNRILAGKASESGFLGLSIMHTVEFLSLVYAAAALIGFSFLWATLWGLIFHMAFDLIYLQRRGMVFTRALSLVEYVIRWNRLTRRGLRPGLPFSVALSDVLPTSNSLPREPEDRRTPQE